MNNGENGENTNRVIIGENTPITTTGSGSITISGNRDLLINSVTNTGGEINLQSSEGNINSSFGIIDSSSIQGSGGNIAINAAGNIRVAGINARGNTQGGSVSLTSANNIITVTDNINTSATTGQGNTITVSATNGEINTQAGILDSSSSDNDGGNQTLNASGTITLGGINTSTASNSTNSQAGTLDISSGNNTTITSVTDKTANVLNGTLNNFAKTGATSNFVVGKVSGSIVTNGLVLNLDASNSSSYSGTGTTWTDLSGSSNNGTLTNGATFNSANGGAMVFDGIDDRVQTNYNPTFTDFTVCVWYKDNGSSTYGRLVDNNYINGFWLGKNGTTPNQWGGGIKESPSPFGIYLTLPDSQWHFLTSVRSGTTHTIYGDGITNKISNTVSAAALNGTSIAIGEWSGGGTGQIFKGNIPQVLIYSRAITEAEIMQIFNATKGKYGL